MFLLIINYSQTHIETIGNSKGGPEKQGMELSQQKKMLEETNIALKVLLEHRSRNFVEIIESRLTEIGSTVSQPVNRHTPASYP